MEYEDIINNILVKDNHLVSERREGYSFYKPKGFTILKRDNLNTIFNYNGYKVYMYVDLYGYNLGIKFKYHPKNNILYSKEINKYNKYGFIEIYEENGAYFYKILYNYIRIEGYSNKNDIKLLLSKLARLLSSIEYNDKVIQKKLSTENSVYDEKELKYFIKKDKGDFILGYEEEKDESYKNIKQKNEYLY